MANVLDRNKRRIIYAEWREVRDQLAVIRAELSKKEGREITEAELLRRMTLTHVNKYRKARGKEPLKLDPISLPGGVPMARPRKKRKKRARAHR
jgi:hypothetical protein